MKNHWINNTVNAPWATVIKQSRALKGNNEAFKHILAIQISWSWSQIAAFPGVEEGEKKECLVYTICT